jgi:hypothetical protein
VTKLIVIIAASFPEAILELAMSKSKGLEATVDVICANSRQ